MLVRGDGGERERRENARHNRKVDSLNVKHRRVDKNVQIHRYTV